MKMNYFITLLFSLTFFLPASAQSPVPIEKEPRHPLKFENQYVRVFNVFIPAGKTTLFHIHKNDGVGVRLTDARIKDETQGGAVEEISVKRGVVSFAFRPNPLIHRVLNIGDTPFHNIFVEILPSAKVSPDSSSDSSALTDVAGYTLVLENERIRVFRLVLAPGQTTEFDTHKLRTLSVAVSQGKVAVEVMGKKRQKAKFKPGDTQWYESGTKHSLKNIGSTTFEAVDIELK